MKLTTTQVILALFLVTGSFAAPIITPSNTVESLEARQYGPKPGPGPKYNPPVTSGGGSKTTYQRPTGKGGKWRRDLEDVESLEARQLLRGPVLNSHGAARLPLTMGVTVPIHRLEPTSVPLFNKRLIRPPRLGRRDLSEFDELDARDLDVIDGLEARSPQFRPHLGGMHLHRGGVGHFHMHHHAHHEEAAPASPPPQRRDLGLGEEEIEAREPQFGPHHHMSGGGHFHPGQHMHAHHHAHHEEAPAPQLQQRDLGEGVETLEAREPQFGPGHGMGGHMPHIPRMGRFMGMPHMPRMHHAHHAEATPPPQLQQRDLGIEGAEEIEAREPQVGRHGFGHGHGGHGGNRVFGMDHTFHSHRAEPPVAMP